jgi:hypothetical protein
MPVPSYGAMPLSKMFCLVRIIQVVAMIIIIGITSSFVSLIVSTGVEAPQEFVGTLSVVSIRAAPLPSSHADRMVDVHCNPLRRRECWFLLVSSEPRPPGHGWHRLPPPHRLHRRIGHTRQATVLPQLLRYRQGIQGGRRSKCLRFHQGSEAEPQHHGLQSGAG